jgi:hypothetical protein
MQFNMQRNIALLSSFVISTRAKLQPKIYHSNQSKVMNV